MNLRAPIKPAAVIFLVLMAREALYSSRAKADDEQGTDIEETMTATAKVAQNIQAKLHPMFQLPISYNYNQNRQPNQNYTQAQLQAAPIIPFAKNSEYALLVSPIFTDNINAQNQQTSNQATPLQLSTFFAHKVSNFVYGIGPFIQMPTANISAGSQQTGLGVSYASFYEPKHWVIGGIAYNAWGVGQNRAAGTANVYFFNPSISYITDNAWMFSLQSWVNGNPTNGHSNNSNQLIISFGQTYKLARSHVQWQIGPTYMVTQTPASPQGWGGFLSLTFTFMREGYNGY